MNIMIPSLARTQAAVGIAALLAMAPAAFAMQPSPQPPQQQNQTVGGMTQQQAQQVANMQGYVGNTARSLGGVIQNAGRPTDPRPPRVATNAPALNTDLGYYINSPFAGSTSNSGTALGASRTYEVLIDNPLAPDAVLNTANGGGTNGVNRPYEGPQIPGVYTQPLDNSRPQLIAYRGADGNLYQPAYDSSGNILPINQLQPLSSLPTPSVAPASERVNSPEFERQLQAYLAQREAQNNQAPVIAQGVNAAITTAATTRQPSLPDAPGYPTAQRNPAAARQRTAQEERAIQQAIDVASTVEATGAVINASGQGGTQQGDDFSATGELTGVDVNNYQSTPASTGNAANNGCRPSPCGSANAQNRPNAGSAPMFAINNSPIGSQTMTVAQLLPIYAGHDPWAGGRPGYTPIDLYPPGLSNVSWTLDLFPPTGLSSAGLTPAINWLSPSSVGWSLPFNSWPGYDPMNINGSADRWNGDTLWQFVENGVGEEDWRRAMMLAQMPPSYSMQGMTLAAYRDALYRQTIPFPSLAERNLLSWNARQIGQIPGVSGTEILRLLAAGDLSGLSNLLAMPFNVVLSWGAGAFDLDLHMTGPELDGVSRFHISYTNEGSLTDAPYAALIRDCVCASGSEVILTQTLVQGGPYRISVYNYGDPVTTSTNLANESAATLQIVRGGTAVEQGQGTTIVGGRTLATVTPPANQPGNTWVAVEIDPRSGRIYAPGRIDNSSSSDAVP